MHPTGTRSAVEQLRNLADAPPSPSSDRLQELADAANSAARANRDWHWTLWGVIGLGALSLIVYALSQPNPGRILGGGGLIGISSAMAGSVAGFLFGLPHARREATDQRTGRGATGDPDQAGVRPNTNLEDISDWLTKILVGVGLTQIGPIVAELQRLVDYCRPVLGDTPASGPIAGGLILTYALTGFLMTFLFARIPLESALNQADREIISAATKAVAATKADKEVIAAAIKEAASAAPVVRAAPANGPK